MVSSRRAAAADARSAGARRIYKPSSWFTDPHPGRALAPVAVRTRPSRQGSLPPGCIGAVRGRFRHSLGSCAARILDRGLTLRYRPRDWPVMVGLPGAAKDHLPAHALPISPGRRGVSRGPGEECRAAVLRHENAVLRRHAGRVRVRYQPPDRAWLAAPARRIPRRRWVLCGQRSAPLRWQARGDGRPLRWLCQPSGQGRFAPRCQR
jgi:hypothetical protein